MARKKTRKEIEVQDYRHTEAKRKNNPPAKIAAEGTVPPVPKAKYEYNPHLPPVLRFDQHGGPDKLPPLLAKATQKPLTKDEARLLAEALRRQEPWLEWTGKREAKAFEVDPVALHIHERVSAHAILHVAAREDVQRSLFGDPQQAYHEAVQFYRHDVDWTNRMILGDSLQVMSSLAKRENLAGKVQMIYMDPPYGIKFASNFQPEIGNRDVKDREQDLTREPEMVKAYHDTWNLGIHSYLSYLRDRLVAARELLADTGSIFVQISDENLHRVRCLIDEVFRPENFVRVIEFVKTTGKGSQYLDTTTDFLLWAAKDVSQMKYRQLWAQRSERTVEKMFTMYERPDGFCKALSKEERQTREIPEDAEPFKPQGLFNDSGTDKSRYCVEFEGSSWTPPAGYYWRTNEQGMAKLARANRLVGIGRTLSRKQHQSDFPVTSVKALWTDTMPSGFASESSIL